jgi:anti-anti-sigma factor
MSRTVRPVELAAVEVCDAEVAPVVTLRGEVDLSNAASVRQRIVEALPHGAGGLVLDLTATTYLDSSGIRMLFDLAAGMEARRQRLVLVLTETALVRRLLVLTKLDDAVPVRASVDDALADIATH